MIINLLKRIFNKSNLNKVILIFIFGFVTRALVYYTYNINVFIDYLNLVSLTYYFVFSIFIVLIHEIVNFFDINIIPSFNYLYSSINSIMQFLYKAFVSLNKLIYAHKLEDYRTSSIKNDMKSFFEGNNKITMGLQETDNIDKSVEKLDPKMSNVLQKNGKSLDYSSKKNTGSNSSSNSSSSSGSRVIRRTQGISDIRGSSSNSSSNNSSSNSSPNYDTINKGSTMYNISGSIQNNTGGISSLNIKNLTIQNSVGSYSPYIANRSYNANDLVFSPTSSFYSSASTSEYTPANRYDITPIPAKISVMPRTPVYSTLTTPETMSPLFPSSINSVNSSVRSSLNMNSVSFAPNLSLNPHPYSNPAHLSNGTSKATLGFNESLERFWLRSPDNPGPSAWTTNPGLYMNNSREGIWQGSEGGPSIDWTQKKDVVISNYNKVTEVNKEMPSKVVIDTPNSLPREVIIHDGLKGKIKLAFKYIDEKLAKTYSNVDNIAVKYHDKSKRKFVWILWEKNSGMFESYEDFKNSWDPKTSIWNEIKNRTRKDIQADVEGILNIKNRKAIGHNINKRIEPIAKKPTVGREVNTLLNKNRPFVESVGEHKESKHKGSHEHNHRSRHKHKDISGRNHTKK